MSQKVYFQSTINGTINTPPKEGINHTLLGTPSGVVSTRVALVRRAPVDIHLRKVLDYTPK